MKNQNGILIVVGVVVLGAIGFGLWKLKGGGIGAPVEKELRSNYGLVMEKLKIEEVKSGNGAVVTAGKKVSLHFISKIQGAPEGKNIDNSYNRVPYVFIAGSGQVLTGLDQGILGMKVGGKRHLIIPPGLAFGPRGNGADIPGNATMIYDVEIMSVEDAVAAAAPAAASAPAAETAAPAPAAKEAKKKAH